MVRARRLSDGALAFPPLAESEEEVRETLTPEESAELTEVDDTFTEMVRDGFLEQAPLYPEAPELSDQESCAKGSAPCTNVFS